MLRPMRRRLMMQRGMPARARSAAAGFRQRGQMAGRTVSERQRNPTFNPRAREGRIGKGIIRGVRETRKGLQYLRKQSRIERMERLRARNFEEMLKHPEAKEMSDAMDRELRENFPNWFKNSIDPKAWKEIKVMMWNGEFRQAEAINFLKDFNREISIRGAPREMTPNDFFRETVRSIVRRRQREIRETGQLETSFF